MLLFEKLNIPWGSWKGLPVPVGDIFEGVASGWYDKKLWQMVSLICVVAAHVYIEQCIGMLNVFKVNYQGHRATFSEVLLVVLLNLNMFFTLIWFSVAGRRKFG